MTKEKSTYPYMIDFQNHWWALEQGRAERWWAMAVTAIDTLGASVSEDIYSAIGCKDVCRRRIVSYNNKKKKGSAKKGRWRLVQQWGHCLLQSSARKGGTPSEWRGQELLHYLFFYSALYGQLQKNVCNI
jgi:hypothetical protein